MIGRRRLRTLQNPGSRMNELRAVFAVAQGMNHALQDPERL
jgi:hypothetical protein